MCAAFHLVPSICRQA